MTVARSAYDSLTERIGSKLRARPNSARRLHEAAAGASATTNDPARAERGRLGMEARCWSTGQTDA